MNNAQSTTRQVRHARWMAVASCTALAVVLAACQKQDETVGQKLDAAVAKTEQAANQAKDEAKDKMASAETGLKQAAQDAKSSAEQAASTVNQKIDDAAITASVSAGLAKDPDLSAIKIDVDTKNGVVSMSGPAPTADARDRATMIAKNVRGVVTVNNQLTVKSAG